MDELVRGYVEGQVSRRVFIRRVATTGISVAGAIAYADLLAAMPASAATDYIDIHDYFFSPASASAKLGDYVNWTGTGHDVMSPSDGLSVDLFRDHFAGPYGFGYFGLPAYTTMAYLAGTWKYECPDPLHGSGGVMHGTLEVPCIISPRRGHVGDRFTVEWALSPPPMGKFDVDVKEPGGPWRRWQNVVDRTVLSGKFKATIKGKHQVRARFNNPAAAAKSGWSPIASFTAR